jgi:lactoylglutathione lyase
VPAGLRVEVFVADLDRTVDFYRRVLGFALVRRDDGDVHGDVHGDPDGAGQPYAALVRDGVAVGALEVGAAGAGAAVRRPPSGVELVLEVDDLLAARQQVLAAGWVLDEDLVDRPWGLADVRLLDPDGYYWRLTHR